MQLELRITLKSDATFGRGDGLGGVVDAEVEHDPETGLPFIRGRVIKGLLVEECANILFALQKQPGHAEWSLVARRLFGAAGSTAEDDGALQVGSARLPQPLEEAVRAEIKHERLLPDAVLNSLTAIRRQSAMSEGSVPDEGSLRSVRVVLRETQFCAPLTLVGRANAELHAKALALIAACALGLRRAGLSRNRGRGRLQAELFVDGREATVAFARLQQQLTEGKPNE